MLAKLLSCSKAPCQVGAILGSWDGRPTLNGGEHLALTLAGTGNERNEKQTDAKIDRPSANAPITSSRMSVLRRSSEASAAYHC